MECYYEYNNKDGILNTDWSCYTKSGEHVNSEVKAACVTAIDAWVDFTNASLDYMIPGASMYDFGFEEVFPGIVKDLKN